MPTIAVDEAVDIKATDTAGGEAKGGSASVAGAWYGSVPSDVAAESTLVSSVDVRARPAW